MVDFKTFKKDRNKHIEKVSASINKMTKTFERDERYWQPTLDDKGNASAIIRFLPGKEDGENEGPMIKMYQYGFSVNKKWFIEKSPSTIGLPCPALEHNNEVWKYDEETARKQKRKLYYIANILVVDDPANPENNGKVFLFQFGKKIYDKIMAQFKPAVKTKKAINVFDMWEGANFELVIVTKDNFKNYDSSSFDRPSAISENEAEIEKIFNAQYLLQPEIAPDKFKSYEDLKKRLEYVLGLTTSTPKRTGTNTKRAQLDEETDPDEEIVDSDSPPSDDEDNEAFFKNL